MKTRLFQLLTLFVGLLGVAVAAKIEIGLIVLGTLVSLVLFLIYGRFAKKTGSYGEENPIYPELSKSKWTLPLIYLLSATLLLITVFVLLDRGPYGEPSLNTFKGPTNLDSTYSNDPCKDQNGKWKEATIGVARFSENAEDDFSVSLNYELRGRIDTSSTSLEGFRKFIPATSDGDREVTKLRNLICSDTVMIVHGFRPLDQDVLFCSIHFYNYHRADTTIITPKYIEFSYSGHSKYIADFILAQESYRLGNYDKAVRLLLESKKQGVDSSFIALSDFYLGVVYAELGDTQLAKQYFIDSQYNESIANDASWNHDVLNDALRITEQELGSKESSRKIDVWESSFLNKATTIHGSIDENSYMRIDADSMDIVMSKVYRSVWLLHIQGKLYCYFLTGYYLGDARYRFEIEESWRMNVGANSHQCIVNTSMSREGEEEVMKKPENQRGWQVSFKAKSKPSYFWRRCYINYDWYYKLCAEGKQRYKSGEAMSEIEKRRLKFVESRIEKFSQLSGLNFELVREYPPNFLGG